jgi:YD repeat-containing protein
VSDFSNVTNRPTPGRQHLDYTYNPDGSRATMTWRNGAGDLGSTWTYHYDAGGRLTSITNPYSETTGWGYDGEGKLTSQSNANGTSVSWSYNQARGWPTSITNKQWLTPFASYALSYDGGNDTVGNLTGVSELDGSAVTYGYDALYRLTGDARTGTDPSSHSYGMDLAGNVTSVDSTTWTFDYANKGSRAST